MRMSISRYTTCLSLLAMAVSLAGCFGAVAVGAGTGALMASDRRISEVYLADEAIEIRVSNAIGQQLGDKVHVNATSYNRMLLLTGEVPVEGRLLFTLRSEFPKGKPRNVLRIDDLTDDFPPVDKARGNITAAFGDVWANVKRHAEANPIS